MKTNFIANVLGSSGYSVHSRNLFNAYAKLEKEVHLDSVLGPDFLTQLNDTELAAVKNKSFKDGVNIMITMPQQFKLGQIEPHKAFVGFCVWEGNKIPLNFIDPLQDCDLILVPSEYVKKAIENTCAIGVPIEIVPHGVDSSLFKPNPSIRPENDKFTFIVNKGWTNMNDRGGTQFAIKAFMEEFSSKDKVRMIIKINGAYGIPDINPMIQSLIPVGKTDLPDLQIIVDTLKYEDMPQLYQRGDVFVSPTMGEAFSIPCAEAMACGIPVITTNSGGQTDFVNNANGYLINSTPIENTWDIMYEGINWAMPDLNHLKELLRYTFVNKDEVKVKGIKAREDIKEFNWDNSALKLYNILEKFK
jgi:glycosyltransferase involved in cell wall biosynthesis